MGTSPWGRGKKGRREKTGGKKEEDGRREKKRKAKIKRCRNNDNMKCINFDFGYMSNMKLNFDMRL